MLKRFSWKGDFLIANRGVVLASLFSLSLVPIGCSADDGAIGTGTGGAGTSTGASASWNTDGNGAASSSGGSSTCADLTVEYTSPVPNVMVLVDRSSSMFEKPFSASVGGDRWSPTKTAIVGEGSVLQRFEGSVNFGFSSYTAKSDQPCPIVAPVVPAANNYAAISNAYDDVSTNIGGDTPTGAAISAIVDQLLLGPAPRYIILATDGEPDTCEHLNPQCGQDDSVAAIQAAYAKGIKTFVIGISSDVSAQHLQDIANAGSGEPVGPLVNNGSCNGYIDYTNPKGTYSQTGGTVPFYAPNSPEALSSVMEELVGGIRSCTFQLAGSVESVDAPRGTVTLGDQLPLEYGKGWTMPDPSTVELLGDACASLQTLDGELNIDFPCGTYIVK